MDAAVVPPQEPMPPEAGPSTATKAEPTEQQEEETEVERCCRICRGPEDGGGDEDEDMVGDGGGESLGKLIRPCACKGSLLYVHEKCQEMWIKTYIRRSDKKPACEVCGQQFRISFTQPHKGLVGFLFSSQSPPLVHSIYLSLLYAGLYGLFLFAGEHHTKLAAFCMMVAVGIGASAALFYLIAVREVDKQVLVYYIIPTFTFAIVIFSQFMGYASLYYKWLSYPGISPEEDVEYKTFLKQLTWRSSVGVLLEGISSTSIVLNLALILCVSFVRFYNFLRHLRRNGGSLANVWMTAPDSTRATILGFAQVGIFVWFYVCGPTGKYVTSALYVIFVALVNWLLRSRFSQNIETGLCRLALIMGYGFVGTMLMGITITHYLAQLADADLEANAPLSVPDQLAEMAMLQEAEQDALSQHVTAPVSEHADLTSGFFALHPTRLSHKMAGNFIRFFYDKNARNDHFEYWNQVFYVSFFLFQTLGIFAVAIWIHTRAVWDHFKDWQSARRQQQLVLLRDELLSKLHGMQLQQRSLVDSVRHNLPLRGAPVPIAPRDEMDDDVHAHLRRRQQLDRERRAHQDDIITAEATMQRVQSNLGHLSDYDDSEELYGVAEKNEEGQRPDDTKRDESSEANAEKEVEEDSTEPEPTEVDDDDESRDVTVATPKQIDKGKEKIEDPQKEEVLEEKETERAEDNASREAEPLVVGSNVTTTPTAPEVEAQGQQTTTVATPVAADDLDSRLQAGAREFVAGVRSIDDLVTHYLRERRTESQVTLFVQYLRMHLSPFTAPEKVRMVYATLAYLLLFHSVYLSLVVIDQDEVKKVWLRYVMDFVGMISILFFIHFNYLTGAPMNHNNNNNVNLNADAAAPPNANGGNGNMGRNYGLLLIGHSVLYFILLFVWIVLQPATFFDPSLRLPHDEAVGITDSHADVAAFAGDNATLFAADAIPPTTTTSADDDASGSGMVLRERLFDALTRDQAAPHDPYALHSLKVMSLLIFLSLVEYGLIALGLTARRLVRIYRIWLDTGTGHFVVHDIAETTTTAAATTTTNPPAAAAAAAADVGTDAPPPPQHAEGGDQDEEQRLRRRRAIEVVHG